MFKHQMDPWQELSMKRTLRMCWTCDAAVIEYEARTKDLGWGIIGSDNAYPVWECPKCGEDDDG